MTTRLAHTGVRGLDRFARSTRQRSRLQTFSAEVQFRFECASLEEAGNSLRKLAQAAESAGFELTQGKVVPAPETPDELQGWTDYGPSGS